MTSIIWPASLNYRSASPELAGMTVTGGRSMSGIEQRTLRHPGFWRVRVEGIVINTQERANAYRALIARLRGGETVDVPIADPYRPKGARLTGAAATTTASVAAGAVTLAAAVVGHDVDAGHYFSTGGRLYVVTEVTSGGYGLFNQLVTDSPWDDRIPWVDAPTVSAATGLKFLPNFRTAIGSGVALDFKRPTLTCRLASQETGDLTLDLLRYGAASLDLVEAF